MFVRGSRIASWAYNDHLCLRAEEIVTILCHAMDETEYAGSKWSLAEVLLSLFNLSCSDANKEVLIDCGCVSALLRHVREFAPGHEHSHELALGTLANLTFDVIATEQMIQQGSVEILTEVCFSLLCALAMLSPP